MKNLFNKMAISCAIMLFPATIFANSIEGIWKNIDDKTGKANSTIEVKIVNNKLYATVKTSTPADAICSKCSSDDPRKDKPLVGMEIVSGLTKNSDGVWEGDDGILDPETGKIYDCKLWIDEKDKNKLNLRGYVGFFYQTRVWRR